MNFRYHDYIYDMPLEGVQSRHPLPHHAHGDRQQVPGGLFFPIQGGGYNQGAEFFPGPDGGGYGQTDRRLDRLERITERQQRQIERLRRQVERLDNRVDRIERRLGY
jgi:hypothetical protein